MSEGTRSEVTPGRRHIIKRPRLTRLLDEASAGARIIMLVAPAGYGKSTLAREWLGARERRGVFYQVTPAATDAAALAVDVARTAASVVQGAGDRMIDRLTAVGAPTPPATVLAELLADDLLAWPKDSWLAIEDYHLLLRTEGELFLEHLATETPIQLLLTTRHRPTWASARRVLYGEIASVGANPLAMDHAEAARALAQRDESEVPRLVALADGWPAVIGLAALTGELSTPEIELPGALYDFFAEELYQAAAADVQKGLCTLALAPRVTAQLAHALLGRASESILAQGLELGFLASEGADSLSIHPLLRVFLGRKFDEEGWSRAEAGERMVQHLFRTEQWDDCFTVIENLGLSARLPDLIAAAMRSLIDTGRHATLSRWLKHAFDAGVESPTLDLADAELAVRKGHCLKAVSLAVQAVQKLPERSTLRARAYLVAGHAAHLANDEEGAYHYFQLASDAALSHRDRSEAAWGSFICGCELELPEMDGLLAEFERLQNDTFDHSIRLRGGRAFLASFHGGLVKEALDPQTALDLADRVKNPMIRASFLHRQAWLLVMLARYDEAAVLIGACIERVIKERFEFAIPHALIMMASAEAGRRRFEDANARIDEALARTRGNPDNYVAANSAVLRGRILAVRHDFEQAKAITSPLRGTFPNRALHGECLSVNALALACSGDVSAANHVTAEAESLTRSLEARSLIMFVRAILASDKDSEFARAALDAITFVDESGCFDAFVTAYRSHPPLLDILAREENRNSQIRDVLVQAHDSDLALAANLVLPMPHEPSSAGLTPRETQVLALITDGLSNRAIANRLHISEATVKVHVRHIFEKLGVRTRTQAAIRAATRSSN